MKVSIGNYSHVNAVVKFAAVQHEKSSWNDVPFSAALLRRNLARIIRTDGMDILLAQDAEGNVCGVLLAMADQMVTSKTVYATDAHFACEAGGVQLLAEFKRWSREQGAKFIVMGIGNLDAQGSTARFYELSGMHQRGDAWVMDLREQEQKVA